MLMSLESISLSLFCLKLSLHFHIFPAKTSNCFCCCCCYFRAANFFQRIFRIPLIHFSLAESKRNFKSKLDYGINDCRSSMAVGWFCSAGAAAAAQPDTFMLMLASKVKLIIQPLPSLTTTLACVCFDVGESTPAAKVALSAPS
jgi:hypothetical protein